MTKKTTIDTGTMTLNGVEYVRVGYGVRVGIGRMIGEDRAHDR